MAMLLFLIGWLGHRGNSNMLLTEGVPDPPYSVRRQVSWRGPDGRSSRERRLIFQSSVGAMWLHSLTDTRLEIWQFFIFCQGPLPFLVHEAIAKEARVIAAEKVRG